jgi:hypothetical protein
VFAKNQFGVGRLTTAESTVLCLPSFKRIEPPGTT